MSFRTARRSLRQLPSCDAVARRVNSCSRMHSTVLPSFENATGDRAHSSSLFRRLLQLLAFLFASSAALTSQAASSPEKIIIDTDIGDDVDDAFAVALALRSPELQILGMTTTFGDTETRAKVLDRFRAEAGRQDVPVAAGTPTPPKGTFTQRRYAENTRFAKPSHPDAVAFLLDQIRRNSGQLTLIAIGPLMNVGAAIDKEDRK